MNEFLGWSLIGWAVALMWAFWARQPHGASAELPTHSTLQKR